MPFITNHHSKIVVETRAPINITATKQESN